LKAIEIIEKYKILMEKEIFDDKEEIVSEETELKSP